VILSASRVQVAEDIDKLIANHRVLIGTRCESPWPSAIGTVVRSSQSERQTTLLVRSPAPVIDRRWDVRQPSLEEVVLAYLEDPSAGAAQRLEPLAS
jgi:ABC-2 type transport system ATP-binding protein